MERFDIAMRYQKIIEKGDILLLMLYIEKNDKRVNEIIIALNNLIEQPKKTKTIGFRTSDE